MDRAHADAEPSGGGVDADGLRAIGVGIEAGDAEAGAQLGDPNGGSGLPVVCLAAHAVHGDGQLAVGPSPAERPDGLDGAGTTLLRTVAHSPAREPPLGVAPTDPVHHDDRLVRGTIEIDDDLLDQHAHEALLRPRVGTGGLPGSRQVMGEPHQRVAVGLRPSRRLLTLPRDPTLECGDPIERCVPAGLEFTGDVALGRIDVLVAPFREAGPATPFTPEIYTTLTDATTRLTIATVVPAR